MGTMVGSRAVALAAEGVQAMAVSGTGVVAAIEMCIRDRVCVEAFTIGGGYIVEPMFVDLYAGEKASTVLLRVLDANSLSYEYTGSPQALFYLARIMGSKISELPTDASLVPPVLFQHIEETLSDESRQGNALGEFDYTYGSGWMYSVNNSFPEVGFSDYTLNDGDVMRVQFTLAYGMDIGGSSSMWPGMGFEDFYPVPNKDQMTVFLANEKELKGYIPEEYLAIVSRLDGEYILVPGVSGLPENNTLTLPADSGEITLWYGQIDHLDMGVHRGTTIQGDVYKRPMLIIITLRISICLLYTSPWICVPRLTPRSR